jgi:hypothetical protein
MYIAIPKEALEDGHSNKDNYLGSTLEECYKYAKDSYGFGTEKTYLFCKLSEFYEAKVPSNLTFKKVKAP